MAEYVVVEENRCDEPLRIVVIVLLILLWKTLFM